MEKRSKEMINVELTKAEALLYMEMIRHNTNELLEQIAQGLDEEVTRGEMEVAAQENYMTNLKNEANKVATLEAEIKRWQELKVNQLIGRKPRAKKPDAPWGYKKDGTPKQRPGRAPQ
jgi:hypothetical protein